FATPASGNYFLIAEPQNDVDLGTYQLTVADIGAGSDDFPATTSTTGVVLVNGALTGRIESTQDQDWVRVNLTAGRVYQIDLEGSATGQGTLQDPELALYNSTGSPLLHNADNGVNLNSRLVFAPTASGNYFVSATARTGPDL